MKKTTLLALLIFFFAYQQSGFLLSSMPPFSKKGPSTTYTHSIASKLINRSSPYDLFRYALAYQNTSEGNDAFNKAVTLFLEVSGGKESFVLWESIDGSMKHNVKALLTDAMNILLSDENTLISQSHQMGTKYDINTWNTYLQLTKCFRNRSLQGFSQNKLENILALSPQEIDVARAIRVEYFSHHLSTSNDCTPYSLSEVTLDILAADVLAKSTITPQESHIELINNILFDDLRIRFPPKKSSEEHIDKFTNIEEVLSSKRGVCLGVSVMYIAILQRLGQTCNIYTPPGHIFLSSEEQKNGTTYERVIETTARGIHIPLDRYLDTRVVILPKRDISEVVGMVLMNDASRCLREQRFQDAIYLYERASQYIRLEKANLLTFTSFTLFMLNRKREAQKIAMSSLEQETLDSYDGNPLAYDIAFSLLDTEGAVIFMKALQNDSKVLDPSLFQNEISKYLEKLPQHKQPYTLRYLLADVSLASGNSKTAEHTLTASYDEWNRLRKKGEKAQFMGLPYLIMLSEISLERSNIPRAIEYATVAFEFAQQKQKDFVQNQKEHFANHFSLPKLPSELSYLLLSLSNKSPGSLDEKITFE